MLSEIRLGGKSKYSKNRKGRKGRMRRKSSKREITKAKALITKQ